MRRAALLGLLGLAGSGARAGDNAYTIYGSGTKSCGKWVAERKDDLSSRLNSESWVLGFVTAMGAAGLHLKDTDRDAMDGWLDNYCVAHPLDILGTAALALIGELIGPKN